MDCFYENTARLAPQVHATQLELLAYKRTSAVEMGRFSAKVILFFRDVFR